MTKDKLTYYKNKSRLWFINTVLIFSVVSFSGYSLQIHSSANSSVKTEIVESRLRKSCYRLVWSSKTKTANPDIKSYGFSALQNYSNVVKIKLRSYLDRTLRYSIASIKAALRFPPSYPEDDIPSLSLI